MFVVMFVTYPRVFGDATEEKPIECNGIERREERKNQLTIDSVPPSVQPINFNSRFSSSSIRSTGFSRFWWLGEFCCRMTLIISHFSQLASDKRIFFWPITRSLSANAVTLDAERRVRKSFRDDPKGKPLHKLIEKRLHIMTQKIIALRGKGKPLPCVR